MKKIPTFWLALIVSGILEGGVWALTPMFYKVGPCGPANDFTGIFVYVIHGLGGWIAERWLPATASDAIRWPVIIIPTIVLWSVIPFIVISIVRRFYTRKSKPAA